MFRDSLTTESVARGVVQEGASHWTMNMDDHTPGPPIDEPPPSPLGPDPEGPEPDHPIREPQPVPLI